MAEPGANEFVEDLFRRESAHLVAALVRLLGPAKLSLAEDVVQDALLRAMHAWRLGLPRDAKAWLLQTAKHRAIDLLRRDRRSSELPQAEAEALRAVEEVLSPAENASSQLAMMFAICDDALSPSTHVTLILRFLCGLSPHEIATAFLSEVPTIERRLHRGRSKLQTLGALPTISDPHELTRRLPSVVQALYLLFNEGYHGSDPHNPMQPVLCADAIHLAELLLEARAIEAPPIHALAALFCFDAARLPTRLDAEGVFVPLAEQDRTGWDHTLIERGVHHLAAAASGDNLSRWHIEAGIAAEHALAPSVERTDWARVAQLYDALYTVNPTPIVALNRALADAELQGPSAGLHSLLAADCEAHLADYPFYWAARADLERRAGRIEEARGAYQRALELARSEAERRAYQRRIDRLDN